VAVRKVEDQLGRTPWLAGRCSPWPDVNLLLPLRMMIARMFPDIGNDANCPRLLAWVERTRRGRGAAALSMPDHTNGAAHLHGHVK